MSQSNDLNINISNCQRLENNGFSSKNESYLIEFNLEKSDGTEFKKIIVKNPSLGHKMYYYIKTHNIGISKILESKSIKIPKIFHIDQKSGYVFREFISGSKIETIIHQIILQKQIKNWQKKIFQKIGLGLAEINQKLKILRRSHTIQLDIRRRKQTCIPN